MGIGKLKAVKGKDSKEIKEINEGALVNLFKFFKIFKLFKLFISWRSFLPLSPLVSFNIPANKKPPPSNLGVVLFCDGYQLYLLILAHESLRVTVRLKTSFSGVESVSGQK